MKLASRKGYSGLELIPVILNQNFDLHFNPPLRSIISHRKYSLLIIDILTVRNGKREREREKNNNERKKVSKI